MKPSLIKALTAALISISLIGLAAGQTCPTGQVVLSISPASPVPGTPLQITVTGSPGAHVRLYHGANPGQTTLAGPGAFGGTVICLNAPFAQAQLGQLPPSGTKTVPLPTPPAAGVAATREYQAVTIIGSATGPIVDTSNVVTVTFGAPPPCTPGNVQLTVTPANPAPGTPMTVTVVGTPGDHIALFSSQTQGSALLPPPGPLAGTVLCLSAPLHRIPLGPIPPSGTRTAQIPTPSRPAGTILYYQAASHAPGASGPVVDTSNVAPVTIAPPPPCAAGSAVLNILPNGPVQPGTTITMDVTAAPGSFVILASSPNPNSMTLPGTSLALCLGMPMHFRLLGIIPAIGTITETHNVPPGAMLPNNVTIHFQAVVISAGSGGLTLDTSNTDTLTF